MGRLFVPDQVAFVRVRLVTKSAVVILAQPVMVLTVGSRVLLRRVSLLLLLSGFFKVSRELPFCWCWQLCVMLIFDFTLVELLDVLLQSELLDELDAANFATDVVFSLDVILQGVLSGIFLVANFAKC